MTMKFTRSQQPFQIRSESMGATTILPSKVMDLERDPVMDPVMDLVVGPVMDPVMDSDLHSVIHPVMHPVIVAQPVVLDHAVPLHHLVQSSLQIRRQKILILKASISNRTFLLKNFTGLFEHALLNGLIKQNEETDNFLTNISGNKWNVSKQRKDILDIIADVVKKSQMELISADKKLEQTMIALIILYAFATSDEKQWKAAVTKGTVVLNFKSVLKFIT